MIEAIPFVFGKWSRRGMLIEDIYVPLLTARTYEYIRFGVRAPN